MIELHFLFDLIEDVNLLIDATAEKELRREDEAGEQEQGIWSSLPLKISDQLQLWIAWFQRLCFTLLAIRKVVLITRPLRLLFRGPDITDCSLSSILWPAPIQGLELRSILDDYLLRLRSV